MRANNEGGGRDGYETAWRSKLSSGCRAFRKLRSGKQPLLAEEALARRYLERIRVDQEAGAGSLDVAEVMWIQAADNDVVIHTSNRAFSQRGRLWAFEASLDPQRFCRVNRCVLVNIAACARVERTSSRKAAVVLKDGRRVLLTRVGAELERRLGSAPQEVQAATQA